MSSKRVVRSYSANGRYPSFDNNEEDAPPVRGESSRNYFLNVRPENRQTFCTIIAQITEETQPGFETTLKSHSVSENADVKFTCTVTGHPAPEITWYKDDTEMDRYCGLPKYQIFHYGKKHSLQLYRCTEDDAAIYQASARNSKGIVSCSGVLEVGTMNEYKIHQRWFARLKQKADAKRRELEETRIKDKENIARMANVRDSNLQRTLSPERAQRKRKSQAEARAGSLDSSKNKEDGLKVHIADPDAALHKNVEAAWSVDKMEKPTASAPEVQNGYVTGPQGTDLVAVKGGNNSLEDLENDILFSSGIREMEPLILAKPVDKEFAARKKKRKLSGEEVRLSLRRAESNSQSARDEAARNAVDQNKSSGILSRYLRDTLKRSKPHRGPQTFVSGDHMEIDEQVSSVTLGQRQHTAEPSGPKSEQAEQEKDSSCQPCKDIESGLTKFTNQEPTESSPQSPARDLYFSMKEMYLETILGPGVHGKQQLPQVMEKNNEADSHLRDHTFGQKTFPSEDPDVPDLADVKLENATKSMKTSEELQSMGISGSELDITMPCVSVEMQEKNAGGNVQQSLEIKEDASTSEPVTSSTRSVDRSGIEAEGCFSFPLVPVDTILQPTFQNSLVAAQAMAEPKASPPHGQDDPAEHPCIVLPAQQQAHEIIPEMLDLEKQAEHDASPASERVDSECSVGAFSDEWEKLDIPSSPEQTDISDVQPTPVILTLKVTEPYLGDCYSEDVSLPQSDETVKPAIRGIDAATQTDQQESVGLTTDIKAMELTAAPVVDTSQIIVVPPTCPEEPVLVDQVPPTAKEAVGQQVATGSRPESTSISLAVPVVEEIPDDAGCGFEEEEVAEVEGELLKVDQVENAGSKEKEQGEVSPDGFGSNFVEKFLSYLKIPSFLLGERSVTSTGKPEASTDLPPAPALHLRSEDTTKERTDLSESPATGVELLLETEAARVPASTEDLQLTGGDNALDPPSGETVIDPVELSIRSLLTTVEEPNMDSIIIVTPPSELSVDAPLSSVVHPHAHEDDSTVAAVDTGDSKLTLQPTVPEIPSGKSTKPSKTEALKHPSLGVASSSSLPVTLENKSPVSSEEEHGTLEKSKTDVTEHKSDVDTAEESSRVENIIGDGNKLLKVSSVPSDGTVPTLETVTPSSGDATPGSALQTAKIMPVVRVAELSQVPCIVVDSVTAKSTVQERIEDDKAVKKDAPTARTVQGSGTKAKPGDALPSIPSATPEELASGARRKIFLPRSKQVDELEGLVLEVPGLPAHPKKEEASRFPLTPKRSAALLQAPAVPQTTPLERYSPTTTRKMSTLEVPKLYEDPGDKAETAMDSARSGGKTEDTKSTKNFLKAPQVIRKIRAEQFSDASGNLKLWCQFFNVLNDSTIRWDKDGLRLNKLKRSAGDESQVSLAIVEASAKDCGVYRCVMENEYGSDATDFLLSNETLSGFISREEIEVGEEIEMTPMPITKGLTDTGFWGNKLFGRIMTKDLYVGNGFRRKASRVKVIYGLEPIFESGATCIVKVRNYISYGTKHESSLTESNHNLTMQECKLQNTAREYSKIFAAETRAVDGFGSVPEVIPLHLLYRPANNIPYATIERDLVGQFMKYTMEDKSKNLVDETASEIEQKCHAFQHWVYQWTNSNLLVTDLQGVGLKITGVQIATNSKGYQGLTGNRSSSVIDEFPDTHHCNRFCEVLGLKSLKNIDSLQPHKPKGSKSPSMTRRPQSAQSSPQTQRKGQSSPQTQRKGQSSPQTQRKGQSSPLIQRKGQTSPLVPRKGPTSPQAARKNATSPGIVGKADNAENSQETAKDQTVEIPKSVRLR
ncbi:alpha-protein kinase 3 [Hypanus sabinus]|uniref:alpha-protein kinase 3 n=1 Tax=Hypanus sabinus TaxID=79690 RepID=UPI0028C40FB4|nr:alpha-protein kinase 3 [Hypanus sabinus]